MKKAPKISFENSFFEISNAIDEYPSTGQKIKSVFIPLAELSHTIYLGENSKNELLELMEKEEPIIALSAAKILYVDEWYCCNVITALCKMLHNIVINEGVNENDHIISWIITAITSSGKHALCALSEIIFLSKIPNLPLMIQYEVVKYAFWWSTEDSDVKAFADNVLSADESFETAIAIYMETPYFHYFNWDNAIENAKQSQSQNSNVNSFEYKFIEVQNQIAIMNARGPISNDEAESIEFRLCEYEGAICDSKLATSQVVAIMQEEISPTSMAAAEIFDNHDLYNEECLGYYMRALNYIKNKYGFTGNAKLISRIIGHIYQYGFDTSEGFVAIKQVSKTMNLPSIVQNEIVECAYRMADQSADAYYFALSLSKHPDVKFRKRAKKVKKLWSSIGNYWKSEAKRKLSQRGIVV